MNGNKVDPEALLSFIANTSDRRLIRRDLTNTSQNLIRSKWGFNDVDNAYWQTKQRGKERRMYYSDDDSIKYADFTKDLPVERQNDYYNLLNSLKDKSSDITIPNKVYKPEIKMNTGYSYKCGGKMMANGGYIPSYNGMPQYGFGSWMKENIGNIGSIGGKVMSGVGGAMAMTGIGAPAGLALMGAGALASGLGDNYNNKMAQEEQFSAQKEALTLQQEQNADMVAMQNKNNLAQSRLAGLNQNKPRYSAMFAEGGYIPSYGQGGSTSNYMEETRDNPDVTHFPNGGTHGENPYGGIPLGNKGSVEEGEVKVKLSQGDYIFSNRY